MSEQLWVVVASSGKYSDRSTWCVAIYGDEESAKLHVERATQYAKLLTQLMDDWYKCDKWDELDPVRNRIFGIIAGNPLDPRVLDGGSVVSEIPWVVHGGLRYWYESVALREVVPALPEHLPQATEARRE